MNAILFRDLLMSMLLGLVALVMLVLPNINPPAAANTAVIDPPGNLAIFIAWPEGATDVDLWVSGPGEDKAIGYSNRSGNLLSLLRDDLGVSGDSSPLNFENVFARDTPAGEYAVNIHGYSLAAPVNVTIEVRLGPTADAMKLLVSTTMELRPLQERTVIRFRLDDKGHVVPGSVNSVFTPLRSQKS